MNTKTELVEGAKLMYVGKGFDTFQTDNPYMIFLGYDSHGWEDIWVDYQGEKRCLSLKEVEIVS